MEKGVQDHKQEILNIIRSNVSPAAMTSRLEDFHENDLADVLPDLTVPGAVQAVPDHGSGHAV